MFKNSRFKSFLKFCAPNRYKLVIWLIFTAVMFAQYQEEYLSTTNERGRPELIKVGWYGKPVIYYKKQKQPGVIYYDRIAQVLAFTWGLTLVFFALFLVLNLVVFGGSFKQRGKALMLLVLMLAVPYLFIFIIGNQFLIDSVTKRNEWRVRFFIKLGIGPNRLGANDVNFPLKAAAHNKDKKMAKLLLDRDADVNMANQRGDTALHAAAAENAINVAKLLVKRGAKINARNIDGQTALHAASHIAMVKFLLAQGAAVNVKDVQGRTPIFAAKDPESIALLIARGAKIYIYDKRGNTVLHYIERPEDILPLVKAGAKINHRNRWGKTALHKWVPSDRSGSFPAAPAIAAELIKHGASPDIPDNSGMSPLHYTIRFCNPKARMSSTVITGKILFKASSEVRLQLANRKLVGQLALLVREDKAGCWQKIAGSKARLAKP